MAYIDLREWISALEKAGELKRITAEVDPILEITEITDRVSKWGPRGKSGPGGPALLFENVKGHPGAKVLINQFGSERRMKLALDVDSLDVTIVPHQAVPEQAQITVGRVSIYRQGH